MGEGRRLFKEGSVEEILTYAGTLPPDSLTRRTLCRRAGELILKQSMYYDHREKPPDLRAHVELLGFTPRELTVGDFESAKVVVERKSDDFASSLFGGRLYAQLDRMAASPVQGFLFIDRSWSSIVEEMSQRDHGKDSTYALRWVAGVIGSLCARGFPPVTIEDRGLFALALQDTMRKAQDGRERGAALAGTSPSLPLTGFPGVGVDRAKKLLRQYGTLERVFAAALHDEKARKKSKTLAAIGDMLREVYK